MGRESSIEWTDHTFNIAWGCQKVSPACDNCYAEAWALRAGFDLWGPDAPRRVMSDAHWRQPLVWNAAAQKAGVPARVFCSSMADTFEDHPTIEAQRARLWPLIEATPWLVWLLLTKRPENAARMVPPSWRAAWPVNVWAGTTVEDQARFDERIPRLRALPAIVRFISYEPLLEDIVDFAPQGVHWLILGGESGRGARPFNLSWVRNALHDAREVAPHRPAVFVKQAGARPAIYGDVPRDVVPIGADDGGTFVPLRLKDRKGGDLAELPEDLRVREVPQIQNPGLVGVVTASAAEHRDDVVLHALHVACGAQAIGLTSVRPQERQS